MGTTARRDAGAGSVYQDARGLWCASVELPTGPDGRRRRKVIRRRVKADVVAALREAQREMQRTGDLPTAAPTLATWLERWLTSSAGALKPRTLATYRGYVAQHIAPTIGRIRLDRLTPAHVHRLHEAMTAAGLSPTSALQAHRILSRALVVAEREGAVTRNVAALVEAPRRAVAVRPAMSAADARTLLQSVAHDERDALRWSLALLAGLRQGEALGLTWGAVDLDAGTLTVAWQLQRLPAGTVVHASQEARQVYGGLWLTRPKSRAGWRQVPMVPALAAMLTRWAASHPHGPDDLVLTDDGRPVDPRRDARAWHDTLEAAGLPPVPLHSARHTTATLLHALGVDDITRQRILGHSSATVSAGYVHAADEVTRGAMDRLGALLALPPA